MTDSAAPQAPTADPVGGGGLRLPRPPGVIRRFWARHPRTADTVLALAVCVFAIPGDIQIGRAAEVPAWLTVSAIALTLVGVAGLYLRRRRPIATAALSCASIVTLIWSPAGTVLAPAVFAVYAVAVHRSTRSGALAAAALWCLTMVTFTIGSYVISPGRVLRAIDSAGHAEPSGIATALSFATAFAVVLALALAVGVNVGNRRRYLAALIDRARQLAVERDQQGQLAAVAERARIAREMHDIVSHSLTVMVALAEGSAASAGPAAPAAAAAMRTVADTGRSAMIDMRRMLGVLGGGATETTPQPGFADLPALIDRFRELGMPVAFRGKGHQPGDPAVQLTVYRLVQESLTNALRYAVGPTSVLVTVTVDDATLTASILDNGLPGFGADRPEPVGSGRGLIGLRERVAAVGGSLDAGPRADGPGWQVVATLLLGDDEEGDA